MPCLARLSLLSLSLCCALSAESISSRRLVATTREREREGGHLLSPRRLRFPNQSGAQHLARVPLLREREGEDIWYGAARFPRFPRARARALHSRACRVFGDSEIISAPAVALAHARAIRPSLFRLLGRLVSDRAKLRVKSTRARISFDGRAAVRARFPYPRIDTVFEDFRFANCFSSE